MHPLPRFPTPTLQDAYCRAARIATATGRRQHVSVCQCPAFEGRTHFIITTVDFMLGRDSMVGRFT